MAGTAATTAPTPTTQAETVWWTVEDVVAHVHCGPKVIYRAVAVRKLRAAKLNGRGDLRFRPEWVDAWLEATAGPVEIVKIRPE